MCIYVWLQEALPSRGLRLEKSNHGFYVMLKHNINMVLCYVRLCYVTVLLFQCTREVLDDEGSETT